MTLVYYRNYSTNTNPFCSVVGDIHFSVAGVVSIEQKILLGVCGLQVYSYFYFAVRFFNEDFKEMKLLIVIPS